MSLLSELLAANHPAQKDQSPDRNIMRYRGYLLSGPKSIRQIVEEYHLSRSAVRIAIYRLVKRGFIAPLEEKIPLGKGKQTTFYQWLGD